MGGAPFAVEVEEHVSDCGGHGDADDYAPQSGYFAGAHYDYHDYRRVQADGGAVYSGGYDVALEKLYQEVPDGDADGGFGRLIQRDQHGGNGAEYRADNRYQPEHSGEGG